jgi:carbon monoxide dehydrogenase subunit G
MMLKTIAIIAAVIAVVVAGILIYAATKPNSFTVRRSIEIKAPPAKIFALINDLHGWAAWSPYEKKDPDMKRTFSGAQSGKGAVYEWDGNNTVGKGRMEVIDTSAPSKVTIKLDFIKPFEGHNTAEFTMEPKGDQTVVTWAMYGPSPFIAKLMGTFINMDRMIGNDFEAGLVNLKTLAEK